MSLLGESGIGKTTLFNIMSGLENSDSGKVSLDGNDVTGIPGKDKLHAAERPAATFSDHNR